MYGPSIIPTMHFEPPKEDNLSTKDRSAAFMLSPKFPLLGDSTFKLCTFCLLTLSSLQGILTKKVLLHVPKRTHMHSLTVGDEEHLDVNG